MYCTVGSQSLAGFLGVPELWVCMRFWVCCILFDVRYESDDVVTESEEVVIVYRLHDWSLGLSGLWGTDPWLTRSNGY